MTNWFPDLSQGQGPIYARLADRIEADIDSGKLPAGSKLPPQRNLAYDLGVTVGTVGRAYALLRERSLVSGEIGRGTYIRDAHGPEPEAQQPVLPLRHASPPGTRTLDPPSGKLRFDSTAAPDVGQGAIVGRLIGEITADQGHEISSYTRRFPDLWFDAGSQWLARGGFTPEPRDIVPTLGCHAAIMAVISAMTVPGDFIAYENVTYSQITRSAELVGRRTCQVGTDDDGMIPSDFERICACQHPKVAFLMPTVQNPTGVRLSESRRREIAEIARRYNVWLIEDEVYGSLTDDEIAPLSLFAPDRTFLIGGLSKSVAAGVRGGWIACPPHIAHRVRVAHKMVTGGLPFVIAEVCARLVTGGLADEIRRKCTAEINARLAIASQVLDGFEFSARANVPFIWLALPEPWRSGSFKKAAFEEGVLIDDEDEFRAGRSDLILHRVRIGISAEARREDYRRGIAAIRRLLDTNSIGYNSFA